MNVCMQRNAGLSQLVHVKQVAVCRTSQFRTTSFLGSPCKNTCISRPESNKCAGRRPCVRVDARYSNFGGGSTRSGVDVKDRLIAALPYLLPFFSAFTYGRYLFYMYPALKSVIRPILPAVASFHSVPFGSLIAFFGIYMGLGNNNKLSRFVRFNAMQALLLDILLVLPRLLETIFSPPTSGWGLQLYANSQSVVWIVVTTCVVFGVSSAFMGTWGRIPFLGEAAEQQIR